jgi:hypothetical protein
MHDAEVATGTLRDRVARVEVRAGKCDDSEGFGVLSVYEAEAEQGPIIVEHQFEPPVSSWPLQRLPGAFLTARGAHYATGL